MMRSLFLLFALLLASASAAPPVQRVELGHVRWMRDHEAALALSAKTGKPVLAFFQEVPG